MTPKHQSMLVGGVVVGLLSTSYLSLVNAFCCLGLIAGGAVGVWHYTSRHRLTVPTGEGAGIGAGAAVVGLFVSIVLNFILMQFDMGADQAVTEFMQSLIGDMVPSDQMEEIEKQLQETKELSFFEYLSSTGTIINLIFYPIMGAVGGSIGSAIFKYGSDPEEPAAGEYEIIE